VRRVGTGRAIPSRMVRFFSRSKALVPAALLAACIAGAPATSNAADSREIQGYDVRVPNAELNAGAARARVQSNHDTLRGVLVDYPHYSQIITRFEKARVVGRVGQQTDVYLEVPILHGATKIWAIVRFDAPKTEGTDEVIRGRMVRGNVKRLDAAWRVRKVDETSADLALELLIVPDLPAPHSLILSEVRRAAARAVSGARAEAERRSHH
jgi:ribosome-associated toxin RatA of RatAB toxin-antitoxin module